MSKLIYMGVLATLLAIGTSVSMADTTDKVEARELTQEEYLRLSQEFGEQTGACIYSQIITFVCTDNVTKAWCDRKPNSQFGEGQTCP